MGGKIYGQRWRVVRTIGEGGQGQVFEVEDANGGPNRVLKRLKNLTRLHRFNNELAAIQKLAHPNVIQLVAHDLEGETPYLVFELVSGGGLDKHLEEVSSDPLSAVELFKGICEGVAAAHAVGIVHRDLKPANVLLKTNIGPAVVSDFGICHMDDGARLTLTEEAVGPRLYMAPELEDGRVAQIRPTVDVYSLGKLLWTMLAGRQVFAREKHRDPNFDLARHLGAAAEEVNALLDKTITESPEARLRDASEVIESIKDVQMAMKIRRLWESGDRKELQKVYDSLPEWDEPWSDPGRWRRSKGAAPKVPFTLRTTEIGPAADVRAAARRLGIGPVGQVEYILGSFSDRKDIKEYVWCWLDAPALKNAVHGTEGPDRGDQPVPSKRRREKLDDQLPQKVFAWLRRHTNELSEVSSDTETIANDVGSNAGLVHQALAQLGEDGYLAGKPYVDGTGRFSLRLPRSVDRGPAVVFGKT